MFVYNVINKMYVTEIDGLTFCCENVRADYEAKAKSLAKTYHEKLPDILLFILPKLEDFYGDLSIEKVAKNLGKAMIDLDNNQVTYLEQTLDDEHIFCFEFVDAFDALYYFSVDG